MSENGDSKTADLAPVLVVDDSRSSRRLITASLTGAGFKTVEAGNGQRALELIATSHFAAVLLDVRMPGMSGLDVLEAIRDRGEGLTLPVILVTAEDEIGDRVRGLEAGANDYIVKPFKPDELVARVSAQLRVQQAWKVVVDSHLRERAAITNAMSRMAPGASPEATADLICHELQALGHLSGVALLTSSADGAVTPLAAREFSRWNLEVGKPLAKSLASYLTAKTTHGPWIEHSAEDSATGPDRGLSSGTGTLACAPVHVQGQVVALLILGADPPGGRATADDVSRVLSEAIAFADVAGGLLGLALRNREVDDHRATVEHVLRACKFRPVFQAIVRLSDGEEVGYEALTRFSDGTRPDLRFAEAAAVDLGVALELATLRAALEDAGALPAGSFLSVNVSPALAMAGADLRELLGTCDRPLVIELSEHDPVDDYQALREALDPLPEPWICVDDAGSGFSSLRHVLALEPDFVKLDRSWVAGIDSDPARQSLVAGLGHFAHTSGCRLIAEGIESDSELRMLQALGVELGQGFLLGHPVPVDRLEVPNARRAPAESVQPAGRAARILLVEDDPTTRRLMRLSLELEGAHVLEAASLAGARAHLEQSLDGAVLDRELADGDGLELLARLEDDHPGIKVVVCSGLDDKREPASLLRVPRKDMGGIVRGLGLAPMPTVPRRAIDSALLGTDAASVTEEWSQLCRQRSITPPGVDREVVTQVVATVARAVERAHLLRWDPDPELEDAINALAGAPIPVETVVSQLMCLREALRGHILHVLGHTRRRQLVEAISRLDVVIDWAIGVAAASAAESLRHQALTDPLTGLLNRRAFDRDLEIEVSRADRYRHALSVVAIDLDGLKAVNDKEGHAAGDGRLRLLGRALCASIRSTDRAYRVGGDEFVILLPDTGKAVVRTIMARAREIGAPSFSWGAASYFEDAADGEQLIEVADQRLYEQRSTSRARQPAS
ncbi:MAG: response regulator [Actinomycetota bacterium]|nr:response regulator [Actinomycetota bacterium]